MLKMKSEEDINEIKLALHKEEVNRHFDVLHLQYSLMIN